jgi:protein adenylyltransferase
VVAPTPILLDDSYARDVPELCVPWTAAVAPAPRLLALNEDLAGLLGIDPAWLRTGAGIGLLTGNDLPEGVQPVAQAYAGHQFGGYSPRLGDGRALLLGELIDGRDERCDLHLKGSGRTPFARGGDGKAAAGPMLREYVIGEAMHALGIPTTRALAVVATGEDVVRDTVLPGAVLARVAASHLRVGTFQYASSLEDPDVVRRLADHAIARHSPDAREAEQPYLAFYETVLEAQASLIARWMLVGFIHGVMNTDNMTISGETIDYGPCAFMDAFDPATVFSSIDQGGRYAYANQPLIAQWNLARLAEAMLPLLGASTDAAVEAATAMLQTFPDRYSAHWRTGWRAKLGLAAATVQAGDDELADDWFALLGAQRVDLTSAMRALSSCLTGDGRAARELFADPEAFDAWRQRWTDRLASEALDTPATAAAMDRVNPVYVPRNHLVEEALAAASAGELDPFERLVRVVTNPFEERPGFERFAEPAPPSADRYQTFCGT